MPAATPRKVIYTADVNLVVEDFNSAEQDVKKLVSSHQGYVAQSETFGTSGERRHGHWKVRVPAARYEEFLTELAKLGVPQKVTTDSQDVSEEFYDVQARIKNKKVEEDRLLKHLEKSTGKLDEILTVEKELSRVRGEIERMEGRLHYLTNMTDMTTVTINVEEIKNYVPPQAPGFGQTVSGTFFGSVDYLQEFGKFLVLIVAAAAPWIPLVGLLALVGWLVFGRRRVVSPRPPI